MIVYNNLDSYKEVAKTGDIITFEVFSSYFKTPYKWDTFKVVQSGFFFRFKGYRKKTAYTTYQDQKVILWNKDEFKNMPK
tara:strand:- start:1714 stop:1953 length:240 start_codon:yes stop_codon:yes gene_type:complete